MRPIKTAIVLIYAGILFLIVAYYVGKFEILVSLIFYGIGAISIIGGVRSLKNKSEDLSTKVFILSVSFISLFIVVLTLGLYYTAGEYEAVLYYEKKGDVFVLKGVDLYAKPQRLSGEYRLVLSLREDVPSFGLVSYDPSVVKITYDANEEEYVLRVHPDEIVILKPNTAIFKHFDFNSCLTAKRPLDFDVSLNPVGGGWVVNIDSRIAVLQ